MTSENRETAEMFTDLEAAGGKLEVGGRIRSASSLPQQGRFGDLTQDIRLYKIAPMIHW